MKLIYTSQKHHFNLWKEGRMVHFDHPLADKQDILMSANLDSEEQMERFKAAINKMIDLHTLERGQNGAFRYECRINYAKEDL